MIGQLLAGLLALLALAAAPPLGTGTKTVTCDSGGAFIGSATPGWRSEAAHAGPFGLGGSGRDFGRGALSSDGLYGTKMPALVEGHRAVVLEVPAGERRRAGIQLVGSSELGFARARFVPCRDKPRTIWPAGLVLRGRAPVTLLVRVGGEPSRKLRVAYTI
jgi:hypothetical protein